MKSNKARSEVDLRDLDETPTTKQNIMNLVPTIPISSTPMPCRSGRVVIKPIRFMYLGKSFKAIIKEQNIRLIPRITMKQ